MGSSSEPSQHSSPCTDLLFLLALSPLWLILRWPMLTALLMAVLTPALLPLTHMLPTELPQLPMLLPPQLLLLPLLLPTLLPLLLLPLPLLVLDSPKPLPMLFPLSDRLLRLLLSSRLLSPLSSGDTRLLTKQFIHH